jgi:hypothetical protein
MRANEFIQEGKGREPLRKGSIAGLPGARFYPDLDNSSPYHSYRFGMAMAGAPDIDMQKEGPTGQKMVTISYSDACDEIVDSAAGHLGFKHKKLTPKGSNETDNVGTMSPVANWMKPTKEKKDKKK